MTYKGATSSRKILLGSSPQGTFLGILLFIILFNGALLRPAVPRPHSLNLKYVDDLSMLVAINLRCLSVDQISRQKPLQYNERTQQVLTAERNNLQEDLNNLNTLVSQKLMKIKESKTQVMKFNFTRNSDFPPELKIEGFQNNLQVVLIIQGNDENNPTFC